MEPAQPAASITRHFLTWIRSAAEEQRAEAALTLAWAYRYWDRSQDLSGDLELCVTALLDDPSPAVRLSLARGLASVPNAPRHIVLALADDRPEIAATVLAQSPVFSEVEIAQHALAGEECVQMAIAQRSDLSPATAACLAEKGGPAVLAALVRNKESSLPRVVLRRIAERFGEDRLILAAMFARPDLPAPVRYDLIEIAARLSATALAMADIDPARLERLIRTAVERSLIGMVGGHEIEEICDLVRHLRSKGKLTVALLLRALTSGEKPFFEISAVELAGLNNAHAAALIRDPAGAGFAALMRRAGFPQYCVTLFRLALLLLEEIGSSRRGQVLLPLVSRLIEACQGRSSPEIEMAVALLRRLENEALLDEARSLARNAASEQVQAPEPAQERLESPRKMELLEPPDVLDQSAAPLAMAS